MARTFWRQRFDGQYYGLFRRSYTDDGGYAGLAYLGADGWVEDPTLLRWWLDPGDRDFLEATRE